MALKAEVICADVEVEPDDPRALVTWARLISPLDPSAEMIELAAFEAQLVDWSCAWISADKVSLANCAEGVLDAEEAVVAAVDEALDPVEFAEPDVPSVENCPVRLEMSLCRLLSICCRVSDERLDEPETCMVNTFSISARDLGGAGDGGTDLRYPLVIPRKFRAGASLKRPAVATRAARLYLTAP
jgi:hypothetical protein